MSASFNPGARSRRMNPNLHGEYDFSEERLRDSVGLNLSKILALDVP